MSDLVNAVATRPRIDAAEAIDVLRRSWGIDGELRPLPSERDRNFAVVVGGEERFVFKVANGTEDIAFLDLQHRAMVRLVAVGVPCQQVIPAADGREVVEIGDSVRPSLARLLTWLPGRPLATIAPGERSGDLFRDLGRTMGRTAAALAGFDHPAAHRRFHWAAEDGLGVIDGHAGAVTAPERQALLGAWRSRLERLAALLPGLRHGVIHNDANDHNVLVAANGTEISGLLDLGDAVWSVVANELAVAAAYAALDAADPLVVIGHVRSGFEEELPLTGDESEVLVDLVGLRLATSVALSAHQSRLAPDDPYLTISEAPAWALLEILLRRDGR